MAYTDPEEARSDLFLSGAVYVFGPQLVQGLFGLIPGLLSNAVVVGVLAVVVPLLTTAVVPVLLARYRGDSLADFGWGVDTQVGIRLGLLLAVPFAVAVALSPVIATLLNPSALPVVPSTLPALLVGVGGLAGPLGNVATWFGLAVLAVYATVKAREAFRADYRSVEGTATEIGRVLAIAGGVATILLLLTLGGTLPPAGLVLLPVAAAVAGGLVVRGLRGPATVSRAAVLTPTVLLAVRPLFGNLFGLFGNAAGFVSGVWEAALYGAIGLLIGLQLEARRTAMGALVVAVVFALLVPSVLTSVFLAP